MDAKLIIVFHFTEWLWCFLHLFYYLCSQEYNINEKNDMIDLKTQYAGLQLKSPIIVGSSGLTRNPNKSKELEDAGAGAIVLKSLFEEQIEIQIDQVSKTSDYYPEAEDYLRSYMKQNQLQEYLDLIKRTKEVCTVPVIASINCYKSDAWIEFASEIEKAGADALELNLFFVSTDIVHNGAVVRDLYIDVVKKVRKVVTIPFTVKISQNVGNVTALVNALKANGADGFVLFNRYFQPDVNLKKMELIPGSIFSRPEELYETLRWTAIVSGKLPNVSLAASRGIHGWEGVAKCILMGANAVQMCSAIYQSGTRIISESLEGLSKWMEEQNFQNLGQFRGLLNSAKFPNPTIYERHQFMKYYSNRE